MVTASNLIYSVSAAARILGIFYGQSRIVIQEWASVVWVWVKGRRPQFISKRVFLQHFADWRKAQARGLKVTQHLFTPTSYTVRNEPKNSTYEVEVIGDRVQCQCEDYRNQEQFFSGQRYACKHSYAVLFHLGFDSLAAYIQAQHL